MLAAPLLGLMWLYQRLISPLTPPSCRFNPSCSAYAVTALRRYGPIKGGWLAARRLARCHPWNPGGNDPVPTKRDRSHTDAPTMADTTSDATNQHATDLPALHDTRRAH